MEPAAEASTEGGGGATSVCHVLSGGDPVSTTFWGRYLGFVGGDVPESGGDKRGVPKSDESIDGSDIEGQDLEVCGS